MRHIETGRGLMNVKEQRPEVGSPYPPLLLVHGAGGQYLDYPAELRRHPRLHTVALDLPAHGQSPGTPRHSISDYAADCAALLAALALPQAIIVGHSMGGAIALTLALEHTAQVAGLVILGSAARLPVNPSIISGVISDPDATIAQMMEWAWGKDAPSSLKELGIQRLKHLPPTTLQADYLACDAFDATAQLGDIHAPTLIISGERDRMIRQSAAQALADGLPDAVHKSIAGAGHMFPLEYADITTEMIGAWVASRWPVTA